MMKLSDLLDMDVYRAMLDGKYISERVHPEFHNYIISNYTKTTAWEGIWNDATLKCRGLVYNSDTGEIVARPFTKFFNYGQVGAPELDLDTSIDITVTEKMDGSLGILYKRPDGDYAIATRGSFESEQSAWATKFYNDNYAQHWTPVEGCTYLFEIIYPENRIVVDYGDTKTLVLLGVIEISSGKSLEGYDWPGQIVDVHSYSSLRDVLESEERANAEGFVIRFPDESRVKIKHEEYVRLHKYLTGVTVKHVWEVLCRGEDPDVVFAEAPDEFHVWLKEVVIQFRTNFNNLAVTAGHMYRKYDSAMSDEHGDSYKKKYFALAVKNESPLMKALMFLVFDDKDTDKVIWEFLKPIGRSRTVKSVNDDAD